MPQLWVSTPDVQLCIHCGVGRKGALAIEQVAHNGTYVRLDNKETTPDGGVCRVGGADVLMTTVDVQQLIARVKARNPDALIDVRRRRTIFARYQHIPSSYGPLMCSLAHTYMRQASTDAGLYLCEFSLYCSLHLGNAPTIFLHLPPIDSPYSLNELRVLTSHVITSLVELVCPSAAPVPSLLLPRTLAERPPTQRYPGVGVAVLVTSEAHPGCVIAGQRLSKGFGQGTYGLPGGRLEFGESFDDCARREMREECGINLLTTRLHSAVNVVDLEHGVHWVVPVIIATTAEEPVNAEPDKCEGWAWYKYPDCIPGPLFGSLKVIVEQGVMLQ